MGGVLNMARKLVFWFIGNVSEEQSDLLNCQTSFCALDLNKKPKRPRPSFQAGGQRRT